MAVDLLVLGGYVFEDFSPPEALPFGGKLITANHKLPGGSRVIDVIGPDDHDITWRGKLWGDSAYEDALLLDSMRSAGEEIPLIFGGQFLNVLIIDFTPTLIRYPVYLEYSVTCLVTFNPMSGLTGIISTVDSLVSTDMSSAQSLVS